MTDNRTYGPDQDISVLVEAILDNIIQTPEKLHALTLMSPEQFTYLCVKFAKRVTERNLYRLFWDDDDDAGASDPETHTKMYIRHALLMSLTRKKEASAEEFLDVTFGVDQGTARRYLKVADGVLAEILPTARNYTATIRKIYERRDDTGANAGPRTPDPERPGPPSTPGPPAPVAATDDPPTPAIIGMPTGGSAIPGIPAGPTLEAAASKQLSTRVATATDGTNTPAERTSDAGWNRAIYSGKKKAHTYNTNTTAAPDGMIIHISETVPGSANGPTLFRESPADFGALSDPETNPETPGEDHRPINIHDRGHRGIQKDTPGAEARIGIKPNTGSDPETGGLTRRDLDHNAEATRARIVIKHAISRIKQYRITTKPYLGTPDQFNDELNVVTGLVNLMHGWDRIVKSEDPALVAALGAWRTR